MALTAVLAAFKLVIIGAALIPVLVDDGRLGRCSCPELHVFNRSECLESVACSSAHAVLEPVDTTIAGPLADSPCHLSDVLGHIVQIRAVTSCLHEFAITLSHRYRVAHELAITLLKLKLDMELIVGVDAGSASRKEFAGDIVLVDVQRARASTVAIVVNSVGRRVALMGRRVPRVLVSLH